MTQRLAALFALAALGLVILTALVWRTGPSQAPGRVSFQIATGGSEGVFFAVGQAMAGLISHPPGMGRCETSTVCGPSGVILSTRTSLGAVENLRAVNNGQMDSAIVQGDVIARAAAGTGPFRRLGPQSHIRVIAALFAEDMHLVVAASSNIREVADLNGKRVALGAGGTAVTAREILNAWHLPLTAIKQQETDDAAADLTAGKLDALFLMSGVPVEAVTRLLQSGKARLIPIAGPQADRLMQTVPQLTPAVIAPGVYPGSGEINTISTRAFWIVHDRANDTLVYGLARALFNPANHEALVQSHPAAGQIAAASAAVDPPAPLQPGAARYYREAGRL